VRLPILEIPSPRPTAAFDTGPRSISAVRVLRISVTDRCNFRCAVLHAGRGCPLAPERGHPQLREIRDVVRAAIEVHGIRRFKLTGGEPTIRHGITDLVRMLRNVQACKDLSLTTNGFALEGPRPALKDAASIGSPSALTDCSPKVSPNHAHGRPAIVLRGLDRAESVVWVR
jgi:uncharacterized radical SAM superfamily Fe-S cluster-containing enzyme